MIPTAYGDTALQPQVEAAAQAGVAKFGGTITSRARSVQRNSEAGGAADSSHLYRAGFDYVPGQGANWGDVQRYYQQQGARALGPGDPGGEAGHLHIDFPALRASPVGAQAPGARAPIFNRFAPPPAKPTAASIQRSLGLVDPGPEDEP